MNRHPGNETPRAVRRRALDNTGTWASTSGKHANADARDKLCLALAAVDAARQQLSRYTTTTDKPACVRSTPPICRRWWRHAWPMPWREGRSMSTYEQPKLSGRRCQCCGGGEYFNGERGFDRHRVGVHGINRRCLSVAEMTARGWYRNAAGFWAMTRLDSARRARIRLAQGEPAPLSFLDSHAPVLHDAAAGAS